MAEVIQVRQVNNMRLYAELQKELAAADGNPASKGVDHGEPRLLSFKQFTWLAALIVRPLRSLHAIVG